MPDVELSQLSNGVYGVAGYALFTELRRYEVSNIFVAVCTFEILVTFPKATHRIRPDFCDFASLLYEFSQR